MDDGESTHSGSHAYLFVSGEKEKKSQCNPFTSPRLFFLMFYTKPAFLFTSQRKGWRCPHKNTLPQGRSDVWEVKFEQGCLLGMC